MTIAPIWFRLDVAFLADPRIVQLGEEFGPAAAVVVIAMFSAAKTQELKNDAPGDFVHGWVALGRCSFIAKRPGETARRIVERSADLGLLEIDSADDVQFEGRFLQWEDFQRVNRAHSAAERQRRYRERLKERGLSKIVNPGMKSRVLERDGHQCVTCGVTEDLEIDHVVAVSIGGSNEIDNLQALCVGCHAKKTADERAEAATQRNALRNARRNGDEAGRESSPTYTSTTTPPTPPSGGRKRDRASYDKERRGWISSVCSETGFSESQVYRAVTRLELAGDQVSVDSVRRFVAARTEAA